MPLPFSVDEVAGTLGADRAFHRIDTCRGAVGPVMELMLTERCLAVERGVTLRAMPGSVAALHPTLPTPGTLWDSITLRLCGDHFSTSSSRQGLGAAALAAGVPRAGRDALPKRHALQCVHVHEPVPVI